MAGVKGRVDLGNGSFNEVAARYGGGIANGAFGGSSFLAGSAFFDVLREKLKWGDR